MRAHGVTQPMSRVTYLIIAAVGALAALAVARSSAGVAPRGRSVEAEEFVLRDADGRKRAVLGNSSHPLAEGLGADVSLEFMDGSGRTRLAVGIGRAGSQDVSVVALFDNSGKLLATMTGSEDGQAVLRLGREGTGGTVEARIDASGHVNLAMVEGRGIALGSNVAGSPESALPLITLKGPGTRFIQLGGLPDTAPGLSGLIVSDTLGSSLATAGICVSEGGATSVFGASGSDAPRGGFSLRTSPNEVTLRIRDLRSDKDVVIPQH